VQFKQISSSLDYHVCGITLNHDVQCWGQNNRQQGGFHAGPYEQVSTGTRSTCAIREDKEIECWGSSAPIPPDASDEAGYEQLSMGMEHACAVTGDSELHCWNKGSNVGAHHVPLGFVVG
jgi:hypothetical protein